VAATCTCPRHGTSARAAVTNGGAHKQFHAFIVVYRRCTCYVLFLSAVLSVSAVWVLGATRCTARAACQPLAT
jgi:hypothetical protein